MRLLGKIFTLVIFWSLIGVTLAATVQVWWQGLPQDDIYWAVRKISDPEFPEKPTDEKLRLARRLEREFSHGVTIDSAVDLLDEPARQRFDANFEDLTEIWLSEKINTFFSFKDEKARSRYLDKQVTRVKTWPVFARLTSAQSNDQELANLNRLTTHVMNHSKKLPLDERKRVQRFFLELALRSSNMQQLFPGLSLTF